MSANLIPVECIKSKYVEMDLQSKHFFTVLDSAAAVSYKFFTTSSYSTNQINITCNPPDNRTIVSRRFLLNISFQVDLVGSVISPQVNMLDGLGLTFALRCLPISRSAATISLNINDYTYVLQLADIVTCFQRFGYAEHMRRVTTSPVMTDQSQSYQELVNSNRNPLGSYYNSMTSDIEPRGGYQIQILSNTPTSASMIVNLQEYIMLSPLNYCNDQVPGLCGINSMIYTHVFNQQLLPCLFSQAENDGMIVTNSTISITQQPGIMFAYYTPNLIDTIPRGLTYPYLDVARFMTDYGVVNSGQSVTIQSNNIQINVVPSVIYCYVRRNYNTINMQSTDTFCRITNISLNWGNQSGLLSSMTPSQIWSDLHVIHGGDLSWQQFYGNYGTGMPRSVSGTGSVLCLKPGINFQLQSTESPGVLKNTQLQLSVIAQNIHPTQALNVTLVIICISPGISSIIDNRLVTQTGVISATEALNCGNNGTVVIQSTPEGGSFFTNLKNIISKIPEYISKALPVIETGVQAARMLGLGDEMEGSGRRRRKRRGKGVIGGDESDEEMDMQGSGRRRRRKGRGLIGGELVTRNQLRDLEY